MQEILKEIKQEYLENLRSKKAEVESKKEVLIAEKYAQKKINFEKDGKLLDEKLAEFIQEKQSKLNDEIAQKRQEVADKKASFEITAKAEAEAEANAEVSHTLLAFDKEILSVEKELGV